MISLIVHYLHFLFMACYILTKGHPTNYNESNSFVEEEDEFAGVATTVLRKDGYAISNQKHPKEQLVERSLRFLQLLCENHNLEMQVSCFLKLELKCAHVRESLRSISVAALPPTSKE